VITYINTFATGNTFGMINLSRYTQISSTRRTYNLTVATAYTILRFEHDNGTQFLRFRITAPFAAQRTSVEKDDGTDSGAVINRESLDIKDETLSSFIMFLFGFPFKIHMHKHFLRESF
jgi:hypothetical protein